MLLKSNNPFSDGYACERIANILEEKNIKSGRIKIIKGEFYVENKSKERIWFISFCRAILQMRNMD